MRQNYISSLRAGAVVVTRSGGRLIFSTLILISFSFVFFLCCVCVCFRVFYSLQEETFDMIYEWRKMLDKWTSDHPGSETKILMTEAYTDIPNTMRFYESNNGRLGAHMPFNFQLIYVPRNASAQHIKQNIDTWLNNMPQGHTASWVVSSKIKFVLAVNTICHPLPLLRPLFTVTQMTQRRWRRTMDNSSINETENRLNRPTPNEDGTSCCVFFTIYSSLFFRSSTLCFGFFFFSFSVRFFFVLILCVQIGSHDHSRVATRMGAHLAPIMQTINQMLPGSSYTYYVSIWTPSSVGFVSCTFFAHTFHVRWWGVRWTCS